MDIDGSSPKCSVLKRLSVNTRLSAARIFEEVQY